MALIPKATASVTTQNAFYITDSTGLYSSTNQGGWGAPNPTTGSMVDAALVLHLPDGNTLLPNSTNVVIFNADTSPAFYPTFPNTTGTPFVITGTMAGYSTVKLPDGIYQMDYELAQTTPGTYNYTYSSYIMMDAAVECCLSKLATNACKCGNKQNRFIQGWSLLEQARYAILCQNINNAASALQAAQNICAGCGCINC